MAYDNRSILRLRFRTEKYKIADGANAGRIVDRVVFNPLAILESSDGLLQYVTVNLHELGFGGVNAGYNAAGAGEASRVNVDDGPIVVLEGGAAREGTVSTDRQSDGLHSIIDPSWGW